MKQRILNHTIRNSLLIFLVLLVVHAFEAIFLRLDETILGENFLNKIFGILVLFYVLKILEWKWQDIGFSAKGFGRSICIGFSLAVCTFLAAYAAEILILIGQGYTVSLGIFTTGFSLVGESEIHTGAGYILMCIFFNIINVIMEEGVFRGFFTGLVSADHTKKTALLFQAFLFGVWHIVTPLHNLADGDLGFAAFLGLSVGYVILAGIMGIKWGLLYQMTGSLYAGMADHFFNNCVATNLLHVTTESGTDEMLILRVLIAQMLSFALVMVVFRRWKKRNA
ncbi:MAG: lysostaphin resistance A-like protein [Lachnospiraceae bacterium]